ncbi:MAG: hypothetical protein WC139_13050 [Candidatus Kapaibacterium sp.]
MKVCYFVIEELDSGQIESKVIGIEEWTGEAIANFGKYGKWNKSMCRNGLWVIYYQGCD